MSLLCAAGHMESSLYVWRRCCDGVGVGDGNWACAAIFRFLLSQTHTLTIVSFSFFADFFLFLLFFWALCTPSRLSYCPTHHTHRCWPSATLAVCLFFFFLFTIRSPLCSLHSPLSALFCTLPRWRSFIHVFSSYLWHSYSHCSATVCVCFFLSVCLCALPLCLCCLPMLLLSPPVTKISLSSFWLQSPHALALALVFYLQAGMHVCVCVYGRRESELYFCFSRLLRCTLSVFPFEDNTLSPLWSSSLSMSAFLFYYCWQDLELFMCVPVHSYKSIYVYVLW